MHSLEHSVKSLLLSALTTVFIIGAHSNPRAQEITFPHCEFTDSITVLAAGLDDILHPFGTPGYPNEFSLAGPFPVFNDVFELYLSTTVSNRWSASEFSMFIASILNNDSTLTNDVFGKVWYYFTREDSDLNGYHRGVRFTTIKGFTYNRIRIRLYAREDIPGYPNSCPTSYGDACRGWSFAVDNVITINASPGNPMSDVLGLGVGHELTHIAWHANGLWLDAGYYSINETLATLAEFFLNAWRPGVDDVPYDASIFRSEVCDQNSKYEVEKTWITYVHELTKRNPSDPTDDVVYQWLRSNTAAVDRMKLSELAQFLWHVDFDWLGGIDATERLNKLFSNFLVAKFAAAPDFAPNSRFGIQGLSAYSDFNFFQDNCATSAGVPWSRSIAPLGMGIPLQIEVAGTFASFLHRGSSAARTKVQ